MKCYSPRIYGIPSPRSWKIPNGQSTSILETTLEVTALCPAAGFAVNSCDSSTLTGRCKSADPLLMAVARILPASHGSKVTLLSDSNAELTGHSRDTAVVGSGVPRRLPPLSPLGFGPAGAVPTRRTVPLPPIGERHSACGDPRAISSAHSAPSARRPQSVTERGDMKIFKDEKFHKMFPHGVMPGGDGEDRASPMYRQTASDDQRLPLSIKRFEKKKMENCLREAEELLKSNLWKDHIDGLRSVVDILRSYQTDVRNKEILTEVLKQTFKLLASPHRKVTMAICPVAADLLGLPGVILRPDTDRIIMKIFVHIAEVKYGIYPCALEAKDKFLYLADPNHSLKALVRVAESARTGPVRAAVGSAILQLLESRGSVCWTQTNAELRHLAHALSNDTHESTRRQGELLQAWFRS